jgi:hypothetical protein
MMRTPFFLAHTTVASSAGLDVKGVGTIGRQSARRGAPRAGAAPKLLLLPASRPCRMMEACICVFCGLLLLLLLLLPLDGSGFLSQAWTRLPLPVCGCLWQLDVDTAKHNAAGAGVTSVCVRRHASSVV